VFLDKKGEAMELFWNPVVHSASLVEIPLITLGYEADALQRWRE